LVKPLGCQVGINFGCFTALVAYAQQGLKASTKISIKKLISLPVLVKNLQINQFSSNFVQAIKYIIT